MSVPERDKGARVPVFNSAPLGVVILLAGIVGVYLLGLVFPGFLGWSRSAAVVFVAGEGGRIPIQPFGPYLPYALHVFIHFGLFHIAMNSAILVSAGSSVGKAFGEGVRGVTGFLIFFFACSIIGAVAHALIQTGPISAMAGASTGVSGIIAAAGWVRGGYKGMLSLALPWIGINILIGLTDTLVGVPIGWMAHIGGTIAGAILFPIMLPLFAKREF